VSGFVFDAFRANRTGSQLLELSPNVFKWGLFSEMLKLAMFGAIFRTLRTEQNHYNFNML